MEELDPDPSKLYKESSFETLGFVIALSEKQVDLSVLLWEFLLFKLQLLIKCSVVCVVKMTPEIYINIVNRVCDGVTLLSVLTLHHWTLFFKPTVFNKLSS